MQELKWSGPIFRASGVAFAHSGKACGQRVRKTQPDGGREGLGISP